MDKEQQLFTSSEWKNLPGFLRTDEGKLALQTFVSDWKASKSPVAIAKQE